MGEKNISNDMSMDEKKQYLKCLVNGLNDEKLIDYFCVFITEKIKRARH